MSLDQVHRAQAGSEDDNFFPGVLPPEKAKALKELFGLRLDAEDNSPGRPLYEAVLPGAGK